MSRKMFMIIFVPYLMMTGKLGAPPITDLSTQKEDQEVKDHSTSDPLPDATEFNHATVEVAVNGSYQYHSELPIKEVFIVNDKMLEVKTIDPKTFYIFGLASGETEIYLTRSGDPETRRLVVRVMSPVKRIQNEISR
ncbi:MAG: pilus assembly protein N-terminal domain-containing protein, partial [Alphaproteobacteria bacterium]|nr:pilus assembly protein N-terminal domain-containing protein [Alphaproteobacteria bacterium]